MNSETKKVIGKFVEVLVREYQPQKIILFGSRAYGEPDESSDIDLLIVKETSVPFYKRLAEVRKFVSAFRKGYAFEPLVVTPQELEKRISKGDKFFGQILTRGEVLYAR